MQKVPEDLSSLYTEDISVEIDAIRCEKYFKPVLGKDETVFDSWP